MNTSNRYTYWYSLLILILLSGCHRPIIKNKELIPFQAVWQWGGNNQRKGFTTEKLSPRLELRWTYKATAALGKAITATDQFILFGSKDGHIHVLDVLTGKTVRSFNIRKRIEATCLTGPFHLIVVQRTEKPALQCIDLQTGKTIWKHNNGIIQGEPLIIEDKLIIGSISGDLTALHIQTGEILWSKKLNGQIYNSMAQYEELIVIATDNGHVWALNTEDGDMLWHKQLVGSIGATPVMDSSRIYIGTREGSFYTLSQSDGTIQWRYKTNGGIYQSAAVAQNHIYLGTSQGIFYCLHGQDGSPQWEYDTDSVIGTSPLVTDEWVFFGTLDSRLYMANRMNGDIVWYYHARGRIRTTPLIWQGLLIFASEDRYIYGFGEKNTI